jgi:hypothetical protein
VSVVAYDEGGFLTNYGDPRRFQAALGDLGADLLMVGRGFFPKPGAAPPEETWAAAAGWRATARSERFVLMERAP